ncbi:hypothetical protein COOONC_23883 [Cooperia oncophora]
MESCAVRGELPLGLSTATNGSEERSMNRRRKSQFQTQYEIAIVRYGTKSKRRCLRGQRKVRRTRARKPSSCLEVENSEAPDSDLHDSCSSGSNSISDDGELLH